MSHTLFRKLRLIPYLALLMVSLSASAAFAQTSTANPNDTPALTNPLMASSLTVLLQEILQYVVEIGSVFLTLMLIFVGFQFVAARGNDEKLKGARNALLWTVIGGLLLLGASALSAAISATVAAL